MLTNATFKTSLLAAGAAALLLPMAAVAQTSDSDLVVTGPDRETRSVVVSLNDLNLRSDRAVKVADARVRSAAKRVCDYTPTLLLSRSDGGQSCYTEAFNTARVDLNSAIWSARAG